MGAIQRSQHREIFFFRRTRSGTIGRSGGYVPGMIAF